MGWLEKTNKYLIYALTIVFVVGSTAVVASGIILHSTLSYYADFFGTLDFGPTIALIIAGILLFFVAFLGCCGAVKESYLMLLEMAVALLALMVMKLVGSVLVSQNPVDVGFPLRAAMYQQQALYVQGDWQAVQTWDSLQTTFHCCGVDSFTEWVIQVNDTPASCHCSGSNNPRCDPEYSAYIYGCKSIFADFVTSAEDTLVVNGLVFASFELFGAVLAVLMALIVRRKRLNSLNIHLLS